MPASNMATPRLTSVVRSVMEASTDIVVVRGQWAVVSKAKGSAAPGTGDEARDGAEPATHRPAAPPGVALAGGTFVNNIVGGLWLLDAVRTRGVTLARARAAFAAMLRLQ